MANASFTLDGDKQLAQQFRRLQQAVRGDVLATILEDAGELIVEEAQRLAPYATGALRESIKVGNIESAATLADVSVIVGVPYGMRREFGFFGTDSLGRTYHDPATPYLRPAIASTRRVVKHTITVAIRAQLRRAVAS